MKTLHFALAGILSAVSLWAQPTLTRSSGWLESAFVEWQPVSGASSYNVYFSGEGIANQKIDNPLIRSYGTYFRADVLGLKAGSYTLRVVPVIGGNESTAATTGSLTVLPHDRSGFAFANNRVPGAYNSDGTPKSGAVVLYITENTKNTVSMEVTGATTNPCVGLQTIVDGYKKGNETRPLILRLIGQVTDPSYLLGGDLVIENAKNASSYITLEGVGQDAVVDGWGIRIKNASNVEIRNLGIMNVNSSEGDNIGLQQNNDYIWVHNNDFFYGDAGSDSDQAKGDGALDCKKSTYVTFSYNHFWDSGKANLLGLSEGTTSGLYITYHHNWFDHSDSRHPRVRYYSAHVYNNYYDGIAKYGIGSTLGSSVFAEANYFRNAKYPMLTSMQGSDVWDGSSNDYSDMPTFSKEDGGTIKAYNNHIEGEQRFVPYGAAEFPNSSVDFDAYVATTRNQQVPTSVTSAYGGNRYNNFDTDASIMYAYTPDSPAAARTKVMTYAGRVSGGDFVWTFNNAVDDASYAVNTALKAALVGYRTQLVSIQGDGNGGTIPASSSSTNTSSSSSTGTIDADIVHNFTLSGTTSTTFAISGNLSTTKGTVDYAGLTLTQCLKIESATSISFALTGEATLTLLLNSDFTGRIQINGTPYTASAGVVQVTLSAGTHTITKGDTSNLFYMSISFSDDPPTRSLGTDLTAMPLHFDPHTQIISIAPEHRVRAVHVVDIRGNSLTIRRKGNSLHLENPAPGIYLVHLASDRGVYQQPISVR